MWSSGVFLENQKYRKEWTRLKKNLACVYVCVCEYLELSERRPHRFFPWKTNKQVFANRGFNFLLCLIKLIVFMACKNQERHGG